MRAPRRTQKQIAERYEGNPGYYNKKHSWRRARFWVSFLAIISGVMGIVLFQLRGHERLFNVGKISRKHATFGDNCASCHDKSLITGGLLTLAQFRQIVSDRLHHGVALEPIDKKCETCHMQRTLHEPNVVKSRSCSACHQEHQGPGPMKLVARQDCISCHNNSETMELSAQKGTQLQWTGFHRHPHSVEQVVFELPRPSRGYTQTFPSLWDGHPEFQLERDEVRDPDSLRFNHQRHFAADIPLVDGRKLDCNYCHKADPDGRYHQRVTFAANCQACHSLRFDAKNPELTLPHGSAIAVRAFLRTLPMQYGELAVKRGIAKSSEIQTFAAEQMAQWQEHFPSMGDFERQVFFAADPYQPQRQTETDVRASFYGCAFCHEVKPVANAAPLITRPILVDRWLPQAKFDHAKHAGVKCDDCHHATQSHDTSDVLMPPKAKCVACHSPAGKVVTECTTCHTYHAPPPSNLADTSSGNESSFKQMLLEESTLP